MSPLIQLAIILEFIFQTIALVKFTFLNKEEIILMMIIVSSFHMVFKTKYIHSK